MILGWCVVHQFWCERQASSSGCAQLWLREAPTPGFTEALATSGRIGTDMALTSRAGSISGTLRT